MVTKIDELGRVRNVSLDDYRREVEQNSYSTRITMDEGSRLQIWDCIDQTWTKALPRGQAYEKYMRKIVSKCSACKFTSIFPGDVRSHLNTVKQASESHQNAKLLPLEDGTVRCTGCGAPLQARKMQDRQHMDNIQTAAQLHNKVELLTLLRYSAQPSEPVILGRELLVDIAGPQASEVEVAPPPRQRRRKRRRNRRGHDNNRR